ncbi:hypothetical protein [Actinobacillus pleuropneumoniae]|uniref:Accessory secretory protein Asp2 n=1 Tax=Actinobacillus pleuropneumoniae TaxID=715 RepID=A0ABM6X6H6_ACTPL|nr:hypothetical protein [Actinobacillus pleuropneumoniae]AWG96005.1 hypothetical protein APPSER1_08690 [Actinobacillus pleuropneumoniae serovar 1 str. 4074]AXA22075.1 hypothetical protein DRF63_08685 [Actinobacillus pleuropneumoniae]WBY04706.1 hypothetical protein PE794_08705 [Actinobacillus pleuropneumoniae]
MLKEQTYKASNGVSIIYKEKKNKFDFKHLIFVFSGFLNSTPGNYDFGNALNDCPANVIWINDNFEGMYSYYLCVNMLFSVEDAVTEFIYHKVNELGLTFDNITVTGFSKGGSAALYYGLKLPVANIVATVPQTKIGSYVVKHWKHVAEHMMGKITPTRVSHLDKLITQKLKQDKKLDRNIYLLTSESDIQFPTEIVTILNDLRKYSNFNLLKTFSCFAREHNQIKSHHTALLLGIYYSLASEATPRFNNGEVNFFGIQPLPPKEITGEPFIDLRKAEIKDNLLFVDGVAILRGYDLVEYSDVEYQLIFKSERNNIVKNLAKTHKPQLTRELFDGENLVIYDKGWFTTYQYKGIDISDIPPGKYSVYININLSDKSACLPLTTKLNKIMTNNKCTLHVVNNIVYFEK